MKKLGVFSDKAFLKKLLQLAIPMGFQSFMLASVAAADALMLGNLEQNAMSAVSLATQIQFVQNMLMGSCIAGVTVLGAQYYGKGDKSAVDDIFNKGLKLSGLLSIVFFLACLLIPEYLMLIFTNEEVLISIGVDYLRVAAFSYLLTGISQTYLAMMKISDHAGMTAKISTVSVLLNIGLNAIFIYGLLGAPKMGVQGAALATLIARIVEFVWAIAISARKDYLSPNFKRFFHKNKLLSKDYWKCTFPLLGAFTLWGIGFTAYSAFMGHLGTDAAGANSVAAVVRDLVCCLCEGLCRGAGVLIGVALGAGELEKAKLYGDRMVVLSFLTGFLCTIILLALTPILMSYVKLTEQASDYFLGMMLVLSVYMIGRTVNTVVINGIIDSGGDTVFDMVSLAVVMWGIAIPLAVLGTFVFHWHPVVVYACTCLDEVGKIPWVIIHYRKYKWVRNLTRENL